MSGVPTDIPAFVVIDEDTRRRADMYRICMEIAYTIPVASLAELGEPPRGAWILVFDQGDAIAAARATLGAGEIFHPILAYRDEIDVARVMAAFHAGAVGYLPLPCDPQSVRSTIEGVSATATWWGRLYARQVRAKAKLDRLSRREREVLSAVRSGLSTKETARLLQISPRTVEIHRANAISKLGVPNAVVAAALCVEAELSENAAAA